ncbi:hypothetical protein J7F03_16390 [Streptomyces sp. ISL-43]|uniref:hypothetical protein n=1 Tax=Streptomyces sp. ISL-43 TaxID=2819183 RepID=UPI001BEA04B3|nr:hypothetical protein [Streptomyces sp. ISL-43]MBT2448641.1 hypothetical protein [Streptomyces sp. ISL-43]
MARTHRFHVDLEGHSVTVVLEWPGHEIEVLVDGKVVAHRRKPARNGTVLRAELPTDPPQPLTVLIEDMGSTPFCSLMTPDARYRRFLMPEVPLTTHESRGGTAGGFTLAGRCDDWPDSCCGDRTDSCAACAGDYGLFGAGSGRHDAGRHQDPRGRIGAVR